MKLAKIVGLVCFAMIITGCSRTNDEDRIDRVEEITTTTPETTTTNPPVYNTETDRVVGNATSQKGLLIPKANPDEKGEYYLLAINTDDDITETIHRWVGDDGQGYVVTRINCNSRQLQDVGSSNVSIRDIIRAPGEWYDLPLNTRKTDLLNFVCNIGPEERNRLNVIDIENEADD